MIQPVSGPATTQMAVYNGSKRRTYRDTRPIHASLLDRIRIDLEERLWSQAFSLLESCLTSGTGTSCQAQIPNPSVLSLVATVAIHPSLTSRTDDKEKHAASTSARRYLSRINSLVGPHKAEIREAFRFSTPGSRDRRSRARSEYAERVDTPQHDNDMIQNSLAQESSVWQSATSFWHVVGWAMNCSVSFHMRWAYWKLWLNLMLDILEDDFESCESALTGSTKSLYEQSLLAKYLQTGGDARSNKRRVLRAIFANASPKDFAEFPEIWKHETKGPRKSKAAEHAAKRQKLDFEAGEFADYLADSDDTLVSIKNESTRSSRRQSHRASPVDIPADLLDDYDDGDDDADSDSDVIQVASAPFKSKLDMTESGQHNWDSDTINYDSDFETEDSFSHRSFEAYGGEEAVKIRQRLLALLARACRHCPKVFADLDDFFDLLPEFIRPLPLPIYQALVCPLKPYLHTHDQCALSQTVLEALMPNVTSSLDERVPTQQIFTKILAPGVANSTSMIENAKVSLALESLLRLLLANGEMQYDTKLADAIENGIKQRQDKASWTGQRKSGPTGEEQKDGSRTLTMSTARLRLYVEMIKTTPTR